MARDSVQLDEFRRRAKAGEFVSGKDAGVAVFAAGTTPASVDEAARTITYDISDATVDRSKDILNPDGGRFENYAKNPVFLFAHDYSRLPIGECVKLPWVQDGKVKATFHYYSPDINPEADACWKIAKRGTGMRAVSIGFVPVKWAFNEDRGFGIDFDEWELIEVSQVPVPCNPNAVADDGKSLDELEAFVKSMRAARAKTQEPPVAEPTLMTLTLSVPAGKDASTIVAELEKKAKNQGAELAKSAATAQDDETGDDLHEQMAGHMKALGEHCAALDAHRKDMQCAVDSAQAHAKAMSAMVDAMGDALSGDDKKSLADALAKALSTQAETKGGAHKLSASQMKRVKSIAKAASEMQAAHHDSQGAVEGEPDDDTKDDGDAETESAKAAPAKEPEIVQPEPQPAPTTADAWLAAEAKRLNTTPEAVIAQLTQRAVAHAQGRLD